jgi:hypothetical protein
MSLCWVSLFCVKNLILAKVRSFVILDPLILTHLQDLMAKKKAPIKSSLIALSELEDIDSL